MAFNPDEYLKKSAPKAGGFDPDAYLATPEEPGTDPARAGQAFVENMGNALSFGNIAQLQTAAGKLLPDPNRELDEKLRAQGFNVQGPDTSYVAERDRNIQRREELAAENPYAAAAGTVAGIVTQIPLLGAGAAAKTAGGRMAQAAGIGAAAGALTNPGDVQGEVRPAGEELLARGKQAAKGAALGGIIQGGMEKVVSPLASWVSRKMGRGAENMAVKALNPTKMQLQKLQKTGKEGELGRMLLSERAIPAVGSTKGILARVETQKDEIGEKIGEMIKKASDKPIISGKQIADDLLASPEFADVAMTPGAESLRSRAVEMAETLTKQGEMTARSAHDMRRRVDKMINWAKSSNEHKGVQELLYQMRNQINDAISDAVGKVPGQSGEQLRRLNKAYSRLAEAEKIAEGGMARQGANRTISLTDTIAGMGGLASGGPGMALALGSANKAVRTYGRTTAARGLDLGSKIAGSAAKAGELSPRIRAMVAQVGAAAGRDGVPQSEGSLDFNDPQILGIFKRNPELIQDVQDASTRRKLRELLGRSPAEGD